MTLSPVLSQGYSDVKNNAISDTERSSGSSMSDDQPISAEKKNTNHEATDQEYKRRIEQYADMMQKLEDIRTQVEAKIQHAEDEQHTEPS